MSPGATGLACGKHASVRAHVKTNANTRDAVDVQVRADIVKAMDDPHSGNSFPTVRTRGRGGVTRGL